MSRNTYRITGVDRYICDYLQYSHNLIEVVVPVTWMQGTDLPTSTIPSSEEPSPQYYSSPYDGDEDSMMLALNSSDQEGSLETSPHEDPLLVLPQ